MRATSQRQSQAEGTTAWGRTTTAEIQEFEIEPIDVGQLRPNYLGQGHATVKFCGSDVGSKIIVYTESNSDWTCWAWGEVIERLKP